MQRRRFLRSVGVVGSLAVSGCSDSGSSRERTDPEPSSRPPGTLLGESGTGGTLAAVAADWGLDDVVDLARAGADDTGREPINDALEAHATAGSLVYLPPGRYRLDESFSLGADGRLGVLGNDAVVVPRDGFDGTLFGFGWPEPMAEVRVRGVTFDFTAPNTGGRPILAKADDRVVLEDVAVRGKVDVEQDQVRLDVTDPEGTGLVERLSLPDGSIPDSGVTGCEVGDDNHGDVTFRDCHIEGFADNGLYADPPEGSVTVEGGLFRNNGIASVRIETSEASIVRGVHVVCDDPDSEFENMRGIRLRAGESLLVEDCLVEMLGVSGSDGAVTFASELESATVRNCRLRVDADGVNAVRVKSPPSGGPSATRRGPFRCENVTITGSASGGAAILASNRDGCEFRDVCVNQTGDDRDGLVAENVNGELRDIHLAVTGEPLTLRNSSFEQRNVSMSRRPGDQPDCELPHH